MKRIALSIVLSFVLCSFAPLATAEQGLGYYERYEINCEIENDRSLRVNKTMVFVNTSSSQNVRLPENIFISSTLIENVSAWDDTGDLSAEVKTENDNASISFQTRWISPGQRYTFHVSYAVPNLVSGTGVEYRLNYGATVADAKIDNIRYENYSITVEGPFGAYPFLSDPEVELASLDPPTWGYFKSIGENETFGGFYTKFYQHPAYYLVTLSHVFSSSSGSATDINLDTILFPGDVPWQSSAIVSSSIILDTLYNDAENNLHAVFDVGDLSAGRSKTVTIKLLYQVDVYDPQITSGQVGTISQVPSSLDPYLEPDSKWDSDSSSITQAAQQAVGGETNAYSATKNICDYVENLLTYEVQDSRRGAQWAFGNQTGDCSEYTDLSITMARASGIPARAMYGWGFYESDNDNDNLRGHAWPEFYFPNEGWQPADPTWAETSGDYFSRSDPIHLTRSVRGLTSTEAYDNFFCYGTAPSSEETEDIQSITASSAAQHYLTAAQYHLSAATNLLLDVDNSQLETKLQQALSEYSSAINATSESDIILHAQSSISYSDEVVQALGEPPARQGFDGGAIFNYVVVVLVVCVVLLGVYAVVKRR
jgi:transglutaminase-like putative cysteine protease